jgi:hypothetical protein
VRELETEALMAKALIQGLHGDREKAESELAKLREQVANTETLTGEERANLNDYDLVGGQKALRIIDGQAQRIARALKILSEPLPAGSPEAHLAADVRRALDG